MAIQTIVRVPTHIETYHPISSVLRSLYPITSAASFKVTPVLETNAYAIFFICTITTVILIVTYQCPVYTLIVVAFKFITGACRGGRAWIKTYNNTCIQFFYLKYT